MRVLLDNCVHGRLANLLVGHDVTHAAKIGWANLSNGHLLQAAETEGYDVLITVDKNLRYQQGQSNRRISVITLLVEKVTLIHLEQIAPRILEVLRNLEDPEAPWEFISLSP